MNLIFLLSTDQCPDGWKIFASNCYKLLNGTFNAKEADEECRRNGGYLASIHSSEENDFIHGMTGDVNTWIGGSDAAKEGTWIWLDGTQWNNTNLYPGQPTTDGNYLEMKSGWNGQWNDKPWNYEIQAICKKGI